MLNRTKKVFTWGTIALGTLTVSLMLHGLVVHQLTPVESMWCLAEEIETSITEGSNLFTTKCTAIQ